MIYKVNCNDCDVYEHMHENNHNCKLINFKILDFAKNQTERNIFEMLNIQMQYN